MKFKNTFDVKAPIEEVYAAMLDLRRVAPCVPDAQVLEQTGDDSYDVSITIELGPIRMAYRGDVDIVERDDAEHRAVMRARARDARGQGTADATVEMRLTPGRDGTHGDVTSDVALSGKAASMGRGIIQNVSAKLIDRFSENLAAMLEGKPAAAEAPAPTEAIPTAPPPEPEPVPAAPPPEPVPAAPPPEPEPVPAAPLPEPEPGSPDVGDVRGADVASRWRDPTAVVGLAGILLLILRLRRRRRRR